MIVKRSRNSVDRMPRIGLVAVNEILVMVILVIGLLWVFSHLMSAATNDPRGPKSIVRGVSDRCVYRISLTEDGQRLWVYRPRDGVSQLNVSTRSIEQLVPLSGMELAKVAHSRDGSTSLLSGMDGTVVLFSDGRTVAAGRMPQTNTPIADAAVSHDGGTAICVTCGGRVYGWSRDGSEVAEFAYDLPSGEPIMQAGLNASGRRMFVGRVNGVVSFHDPVTGTPLTRQLQLYNRSGHRIECSHYAWSDDEGRMAAASSDGSVRVYNLEVDLPHLNAELHTRATYARPTALEFSPDGRLLALATNVSAEIHLWHVESGAPAGTLCGHDGVVRTLQFARGSDSLFSGSYDGTIREWSLADQKQLRVVD